MRKGIYIIIAFLLVIAQVSAQTYTYDNLNRLTKVVYDNGVMVTYDYDALGNRTSRKVTGATASTFVISVAVSPMGSGTVTGGGTYSDGASVELNAIANAGYEFFKWNDGETENPRVITVSKDLSLTAQFNEVAASAVKGDLNSDGKVNYLDMNALVDAYLYDTRVTSLTDMDSDGALSIADIAQLIDMMKNGATITVNNNGHEYVDLGLPSGTLWATCNVGASAPEESGGFYAWGETQTKSVYSWATYKWCDGDACSSSDMTLTKYCDRGGYGLIDGKISLELDDDVAHVEWGGDWHIPTVEQIKELSDQCTVEWIRLVGELYGYKFTGPNGNSIVMPAAGQYRNSSLYDGEFYYMSSELFMRDIPANNHATHIVAMDYADDDSVGNVGVYRYIGFPVRPVLSEYTPITHQIQAPESYLNHNLVDLGLPSGTLWATCNLGASTSSDYGCYYAWGETESSCDGKSSFSDNTYYYYDGDNISKYNSTDNLTVLEKCDDAASVKWGGEWRMPSWKEMTELKNSSYTTWTWTTENGVNGLRVTSIVKGFEGNSIFLPAGGSHDASKINRLGEQGHYWSSLLDTESESCKNASYLYFRSSGWISGHTSRSAGRSIRPVVSLDDISK